MQCLESTSSWSDNAECMGLDGVELGKTCWRPIQPGKMAKFHQGTFTPTGKENLMRKLSWQWPCDSHVRGLPDVSVVLMVPKLGHRPKLGSEFTRA